jgi:hypothetical protein
MLRTIAQGRVFALAMLLAATAAAEDSVAKPAAETAPPAVVAKKSAPQPDWPLDRFLVFSNMLSLPPIQVLAEDQEIQVGTEAKLRMSQITNSPAGEMKRVADELGVPVGLVLSVVTNANTGKSFNAPEMATQLRSAAIDYHFLLVELTRYHPGENGRLSREEAMQNLADGNLPPVWDFYRRLPWPKPPQGLRTASGQ